eukprot:GABV01002738.1.p1 GENE.GABV01002738.1~~GABV01002738.1.p1  ORF type:complete len:125 (-),score=31.79 GABV01002738.1:117-491(-)
MVLERLSEHIMRPDARILEICCCSGYFCALVAAMNDSAQVFGVDDRASLIQRAQTAVNTDIPQHADRIHLAETDGRLGLPDFAPLTPFTSRPPCPKSPASSFANSKSAVVSSCPPALKTALTNS